MILRVWADVDGKTYDCKPLENKQDYWYCIVDWSPKPYHVQIWAENDRGARGYLDTEVQITYVDKAHTKVRLVLYPYSVTVFSRSNMPFSDAGRSRHMMESESFSCGENRRVSLAVKSTDHHPFEITNANFELSNGMEIEASGDCEVDPIRSDFTIIRAKIQPMKASCLYTLHFNYDVNNEHLVKDVTVRVE